MKLFKHYLPTAAEKQSQNRAAAEPSNNNYVAFSQPWTEGSKTDSRACYTCGGFGHLVRDCIKAKNEDKVAIFRKGDAALRASRAGKSTAPQATPSTTSEDNTKTAVVNPDTGSIHVDAAVNEVSLLSQTSFVQFARYKAFLASGKDGEIKHLQAFGIMEDEDDDGIDLDEFSFFCLVKPRPRMPPF